jgi:hypothetical protein
MRLLKITLVLAVAIAAVPAASASAANTFEGSCALSGRLTFDPPLGNELRETAFADQASGTCTGTLNGVPQDAAPVAIRARGSGLLSCLAGDATTSDTLTFTRGTRRAGDDLRIRFSTATSGAALEFVARVSGNVSGSAVAHVNFAPYTDQAATEACFVGTLGSAQYDLTARTLTPLVG